MFIKPVKRALHWQTTILWRGKCNHFRKPPYHICYRLFGGTFFGENIANCQMDEWVPKIDLFAFPCQILGKKSRSLVAVHHDGHTWSTCLLNRKKICFHKWGWVFYLEKIKFAKIGQAMAKNRNTEVQFF